MGSGAELKKFTAGRDINNALMSETADFGNFGIVPTAVGLTSGNDFKVIWIECLIKASEALAVREGSGIESMEDLKGKKVAVTLASSGHYGLLCALEDAGMSESDIEILDMDPNATYAAWERGDIDAAYTWNPALSRILSSGGKLLVTAGDLAQNGHQTINFHVVRTAYANEHPEMVKGYVAALAKGAALYHENEAEALRIMSVYLDMSEEDVKSLMVDDYVLLEDQVSAFGEDTVAQNIYSVAQFLKKAGQISDEKDLEFFKNAIDTSYIEAVVAQQ
jgi:taurine transport system substrate-binding protein